MFHHPHDTFHPNNVHPPHPAELCEDQLPLFSRVGRGIKGDSFYVGIAKDSEGETILEGKSYDNATKTWTTEWMSQNINGGKLSYAYTLHPDTLPRTFTITFVYKRPGREGWSWTTPHIPYFWSTDGDGFDPDHIVGSGVATVFVRASKNEAWNVKKHERLVYPKGTTRNDFNAPMPEEPWSANITFGIGGDIELPCLDDLAKIIGTTVENLRQIVNGNTVTINGINARNLIDYINKCDKRDRDHFHKDLGFNSEGHAATGAFGKSPITGNSYDTVKQYIDEGDKANKSKAQAAWNLAMNLLKKIYRGTDAVVEPETGEITWPSGTTHTKIPLGDLNVFAGYQESDIDNGDYTDAIRSRTLSDDDISFR